MDQWHLNNVKVILTLWTLNVAELCIPFSCIDCCVFDEIKWWCAFTKRTTQKIITKLLSASVSWYYLHLVHLIFNSKSLWKCRALTRVSFSYFPKVALGHDIVGAPQYLRFLWIMWQYSIQALRNKMKLFFDKKVNGWKLLLTVVTESFVLNVTGLLDLTLKCIS